MRKYEFYSTVNQGTQTPWVQWSGCDNSAAKAALEGIKGVINPLVLSEATWPHTIEFTSKRGKWHWKLFQQERVIASCK